nr:MAG TPA: hypothetical protein [Caudoviricetes sp.]
MRTSCVSCPRWMSLRFAWWPSPGTRMCMM